MKTPRTLKISGVALALALVPACARAQMVTTSALLGEMADLASMTRFPAPSYTSRQFSSYDRASGSPRWEWFANGDRGQYLRTEQRGARRENVLLDISGPGAVMHLWSANPEGTLRIYLDGSESPVIEEKMTDLLSGAIAGFPRPIAGIQSRGYNLYFPIPFARSCKITGDSGDIYYTAAVRQYSPGTPVETFRRDNVDALQLRSVAARLSAPQQQGVRSRQTRPFNVRLAPGARAVLSETSGLGAITSLRARLNGVSESALRALVLRGRFDGEQTIEVPLGDFFGTAPGASPFATLPLGITQGGEAWSHWVMPWRQSARLEVVNMGRENVALGGEVGTAPYAWGADSMHFHVGYKSRYDLATRPMRDLQVLEAGGEGVFAGLSMAIDNPNTKWWGEGDEKIYVDGEAFPSWFGTGTEDYFGYAWCDTGEFEHAYHAQPRADGPGGCGGGRGHWGRASNNRFHIVDRIPFRQALRFDMELQHWVEARVNVATTAYWYAKPGSVAAFARLRAVDLEVRPMPEYAPARVAGAIEGESMRVVSNTAKTAQAVAQAWEDLSGGEQMWWHPFPAPGERLTLSFDAPQAGRYRVFGRFLQARDYGIHQLSVNGAEAGAPRDFYAPTVTPAPEIELGIFELKATGNTFAVTAVGANALAGKGNLFGLDYLRLQPEH